MSGISKLCFTPYSLHRITVATLLLLSYSGIIHAQHQSQSQPLVLNKATIFLRGAELFSTSSIELAAGETEVVFTNLANNIKDNTLSVRGNNGVVILSSVLHKNYLHVPVDDAAIEVLKIQLEDEYARERNLLIRQQVIEQQIDLINNNNQLGGRDSGIIPTELAEMLILIERKMLALLMENEQVEQDLLLLKKQQKALENQLSGYLKNDQPQTQLVVKFISDRPITTNVDVSYVIDAAGWRPYYDIRVDKIHQPVMLNYKGHVYQNSGFDWKNVRLQLSTGNPTGNPVIMPSLNPRYLALRSPESRGVNRLMSAPAARATDMYDDAYADEPHLPNLKQELASDAGALADYIVTQADGVNVAFTIALPYDIPSNNSQHQVVIRNEQINGDYRYFAVPGVSDDVFLQVMIKDWQKLNLLPGESQIFFEGGFIGQGEISTEDIDSEGLLVSLGIDKQVTVRRTNDGMFKEQPTFLGSNISQKFSYSLEAVNGRPDDITLLIRDQLPVSTDSDISVTEVNMSEKVNVNKNTGMFDWQITLAAAETKKFNYSYVVKYPKDRQLLGL